MPHQVELAVDELSAGKTGAGELSGERAGDNPDPPADVPPSVAAAAGTLLYESIELAREDGRVWYINGQHRTEAMLRQGIEETVLLATVAHH